MYKVYTKLSVLVIFLSCIEIVQLEDTDDTSTPSVEEYYETVLELHQKYHELDQAMLILTEENPVKDLIEEFVKPLKSQMSDLSKEIKAAYSLTGKEASEAFIQIQATYHMITNGLAELDIKHSDLAAEGEEKKENFTIRIELLLGELRNTAELQKKLNIDSELDALYGGEKFDENKMNISTQIEVQVLKLSLGLIKDIPAVLKQLKEENGEDVSSDENLSQLEQENQLSRLIMKRKNLGLTPSALIPKMAQTVDEINEYFQAKISENYEIMSEEFAEQSKKLTAYWNQIQKKIDQLEEYVQGDLDDYMDKEGEGSRDEL